jgi:4-amino-4-deoxy-L-arabinose transferase-like glycosyltransferase
VLAADATTKAITSGRLQPLLLAGLWVGLAFQTKMLQAWLVLPALFLAYVVAAPTPDLVRRVGHVLLCAAITLGVSLSWMLAVSAVPAHDRPYADASCNNSVFSQVFLYNGADRLSGRTLDQAGCTRATTAAAQGPGGGVANQTVAVPRGPGRFLNGAFGRDGDWLLVPAAVALVGILVARRREPRTDALRAGALLWAAWLFFTWSFFADSHFLNSYYLAALAPPIAALCGMGFALAWRLRAQRAVRAVLLGTVAAGTAYALYLLPAGAGVRPWVIATTLLLAVVALVVTARSLTSGARSWTTDAGVVLSAAALFAGTAWAAGTVVEAGLGPFDSPYQPASSQARAAAAARTAADDASLQRAAARVPQGVSVLTVSTSATASWAILATGREFLPIGGFSGRVPSPTLTSFVADVRTGKVTDVLVPVSPRSHNPDMEWVTAHCAAQPDAELGADRDLSGQRMRFYRCSPADASLTTATTGEGFTARP